MDLESYVPVVLILEHAHVHAYDYSFALSIQPCLLQVPFRFTVLATIVEVVLILTFKRSHLFQGYI